MFNWVKVGSLIGSSSNVLLDKGCMFDWVKVEYVIGSRLDV